VSGEGVTGPGWLDEDEPHEPARAAEQLAAVEALLAPPPRRVLDLGCGAGRVLVPLAARGHDVVGIDRRRDALDRCAGRLDAAGARAELVEGDFTDAAAWPAGPFHAVLCLGNTFMELHDVDDAVALLSAAAGALATGGAVVIDDIPGDLWPELAEGYWQAGEAVTDDGPVQIVWEPADAVCALRRGADIGPAPPGPADRRFRLWTDGALRLAARVAGLSPPARGKGAHLIVMAKLTADPLPPQH
jgi:SAM-dependent methyltransferase